jgi:hypothetical protein
LQLTTRQARARSPSRSWVAIHLGRRTNHRLQPTRLASRLLQGWSHGLPFKGERVHPTPKDALSSSHCSPRSCIDI